MWLFDDASEQLPGGYEQNELSPKSPATALKSFPQDLVLVARSSVLIKGLAAKLGVRWSLAKKWATIAADALDLDPAFKSKPPSPAARAATKIKRYSKRLLAPLVRRSLTSRAASRAAPTLD